MNYPLKNTEEEKDGKYVTSLITLFKNLYDIKKDKKKVGIVQISTRGLIPRSNSIISSLG